MIILFFFSYGHVYPEKVRIHNKMLSNSSSPKAKRTPQKLRNSPNPSSSPKQTASPRLKELKQLQKMAISNLNFKAAEEYDRQIKQLTLSSKSAQVAEIQENFKNAVYEHVEFYQNQLREDEKKRDDEDFEFRKRINQNFNELQEKQISEMIELEKSYATFRLHETQRNLPEYEEIIAEAKFAGTIGDFEKAQELQNIAISISQAQLGKRLEKIDKDFQTRSDTMREQHGKEITVLVKRFENGLKKLGETDSARNSKNKNLFEARVITELQKAVKMGITTLQLNDSSEFQKNLEIILAQIMEEKNISFPKNLCKTVRSTSKLQSPKKLVTQQRK